MIYKETAQYEKNKVAYDIEKLYFLGIPIYKRVSSTTDQNVVNVLINKEKINIKGFNNEITN